MLSKFGDDKALKIATWIAEHPNFFGCVLVAAAAFATWNTYQCGMKQGVLTHLHAKSISEGLGG